MGSGNFISSVNQLYMDTTMICELCKTEVGAIIGVPVCHLCADTLAAKLSEYESSLRDIASSRARVGGHAMCRAIAEGVLKRRREGSAG